MSYAHTKRRKLIASLKRRYPRGWLRNFDIERARAQRKLHGRCTGSIQDLIDKGLIPAEPAQ